MTTMDSGPADQTAPQNPWRFLAWELGLFAFALALLHWQQWGPRDVVWSLWSTSLLTGYITIVLAIVGPALASALKARTEGGLLPALGILLAALFAGGFFIAFFSVHFGMFHAVHGAFLNEFFPLREWGLPQPNLLQQMLAYWRDCWELYPGFIALCVLSHLPQWLQPAQMRKSLMLPYANVVKLHFIILAIGFSQAAGLQATALIIFLAVYFLPLGRLWRLLRGAASRPDPIEARN